MKPALRIAVVGAESTGKSTLALALARRLEADLGLRTACVPEVLRDWCDAHGRTPMRAEQMDIARAQANLIDDAAASAEVVICDTTPLMTAVYSRLIFDDGALDAMAREFQATMALTLLTALDLPWVADGLQRDGPQVRGPVDALIRGHLGAWSGDWAVVSGAGDARTMHALDSLRPVLARWIRPDTAPGRLFSRLLADGATNAPGGLRACTTAAHCELCDCGDLEHLRRRG